MDKTLTAVAGILVVVILGCAVLFGLPLLISPQASASGGTANSTVTVYFFYGEECPHCHTVMPVIESLREKYPDVNFEMLETWHNDTNMERFVALNSQLGRQGSGVPEAVVGTVILVGDKEIPEQLENAIIEEKKKH